MSSTKLLPAEGQGRGGASASLAQVELEQDEMDRCVRDKMELLSPSQLKGEES